MRAQRGPVGIAFAVVGVLVLMVVAAGGTLLYGRGQLEPVSGTPGPSVRITVTRGESADVLVADLAAHHLIRSDFWFGWYAHLQGLAGKLVPGHFLLDDGMSSGYIIQVLEGPPLVTTHRVVLTEGMVATQMADKVAASGLGISADQYLAEVEHGRFTEPFLSGRPTGASLEGFLFPDTYDIAIPATAHEVVQLQLDTFARKALPRFGSVTPQQLYATLTTASLVEREARFDDDRPLVASVIENRLANSMLLQIDASVLYGLGVVDRPMNDADKAVDTPYNTYRHPGLPPTPIANPGAQSINASAHPASTDYLFYVSDGCGHNHYSHTEQQHEQQVAMYVGKPC